MFELISARWRTEVRALPSQQNQRPSQVFFMYVVYVLYSETFDKIYIGYTSNLEQRLLSHNFLARKGWTIQFRPWKTVRTEEFFYKKDAMVREKQLKSAAGRRFIRSLIKMPES